METGLFVAFEGCEGSGKSTQSQLLYERIRDSGFTTLMVHEPGTTPLGNYLRNYLKSKLPLSKEAELLLFEAARAQLVADHIKPNLEHRRVVISDRYIGSSIAYQGYGRNIDIGIIEELNEFATTGIIPDITFLLDVEPAEGLRRVGSPQLYLALEPDAGTELGRLEVEGHRRFEDQPLKFHSAVRDGYLKIAEKYPDTWTIVDANRPQGQIAEEIWHCVSSRLPAPKELKTPQLELPSPIN